MLVLGVDPGSEITGYGLIDSDGHSHHAVDYGAIRTQTRKPFPSRLLHIFNQLTQIVHRYEPDAVALEDVFYSVNVKSLLKLGHMRGIVLVVAAQAEIPVYEYSPLEVKSAVVGYGRADKQQVQKMVQLILKLKEVPVPHDASDALAVAICHLHRSKGVAAEPSAMRRRRR